MVGTEIRPQPSVLERFQDDDGLVGYRSPLLAELGVPHLFTTRIGPGERELDLGRLDARAREHLARAAGAPRSRIVSVRQVHGAEVFRVPSGALPEPRPEADALVGSRADVLLCVQVADCVPVLLASPDGSRVAAVHAGWRGLVAGVLPRALEHFGEARPVAAIGPCLSSERFEVGLEVAEAFARAGLAATIHARPGVRPHIDLRAAAALQLEQGGVERIDVSDRCTWTHAAEFFSHRRDVTHGERRSTGRTGALIGAAPR